jgi:3-oxoacyl-[acyl-carrier protein] reductase
MANPILAISTSLEGQAAVVTGSSSGIGRAIALELARAGADVLVHARTSRSAAEAVAQQIGKLGRESLVHLVDLREATGHSELCQAAWKWRNIDIWINNAGADVLTGNAADWEFDRKLEEVWRVDVAATVALCRAVGERMKKRGHGVLVNIGWDQADVGMAGEAGELFTTSKGAVMAFTRSLAKSLAPTVRVNCVAPGWIQTDWANEASEYWTERAIRESLLGRWGQPEDIARAVRFLASDEASFITGQVLHVNGGFAGSKP